MLVNAIYIFFIVKDIFKHDGYVTNFFCIRPWSFDCEKSPTFLACGKCLVQEFSFTLMFLNGLPFQKIISPRNIAYLVEKTKQKYVFAKIDRLYFYNS